LSVRAFAGPSVLKWYVVGLSWLIWASTEAMGWMSVLSRASEDAE
jgi:hypothetical protein